MISKRDACWPATRSWLEARIAEVQTQLEGHQPESITNRLRGNIEAFRAIIKVAEPEPLRVPNKDTTPGY